jgi:peptide subunit release factor 1 (eRF1)
MERCGRIEHRTGGLSKRRHTGGRSERRQGRLQARGFMERCVLIERSAGGLIKWRHAGK